MKIYKISIQSLSDDEHLGYTYCRNTTELNKTIADQKERGNVCTTEIIDFTVTKSAIIDLLNSHGGHPNNG